MILLVNAKKLRDYSECYKKMKVVSSKYIRKQESMKKNIKEVIQFYYNNNCYRNTELIIDLYKKTPKDNEIFKNIDLKSNCIESALFEISKKIK